jgi:cytidylate kinase
MIPIVINVRGTSGSGKTFLIRSVMEEFGIRSRMLRKDTKKIAGYVLNKDIYILGSYETECGGADSIKTLDEVDSRVRKASEKYNTVLFEGMLVSDVYGRYEALSKSLPPRALFVWGILDTPLDVCIERVVERRMRKGVNLKEFDPKKHTIPRFDKVVRGKDKAINAGQLVVLLDHKDVTNQVLRIIKHRRFPKERTYNLRLYSKEGIEYDR